MVLLGLGLAALGVRVLLRGQELLRITGQADRRSTNMDWSVVEPRDTARRTRMRAILDAGQLRTADDYYAAAFVFQHGGKPED